MLFKQSSGSDYARRQLSVDVACRMLKQKVLSRYADPLLARGNTANLLSHDRAQPAKVPLKKLASIL